MVLKQRFEHGRTAYTDIGDNFLYIQQNAEEFKDACAHHFEGRTEFEKDCIGLIQYGERKTEPIYKDFPQWVYSNDGQLFITLTNCEWDKNVCNNPVQNILADFFNSKSDANKYLTAEQQEDLENDFQEYVTREPKQRNPTRYELQAMLQKMDFFKVDHLFMATAFKDELFFFEKEKDFPTIKITRTEVEKMIDES